MASSYNEKRLFKFSVGFYETFTLKIFTKTTFEWAP